jgi:hypothetical protein
MRRLHHAILIALCALSGAGSAAPTAIGDVACEDRPEILEISSVAGLSAIDRPGNAPVYEVKYHHCGREYRLLIRQPVDSVIRPENRFNPMVF